MSLNSMVWRPTPADPPPVGDVPDRLAYLLETWLRESTSWDYKPLREEPYTLRDDERTVGFLEGLNAAGVEGAADLLSALTTRRSIDLWYE